MTISVRAAGLCVVMLLAACGSSPATAYYSLSAVSGKTRSVSLGTIEVRRPGIAGYLDRAEILTQWDGHRLQLTQNTCWAEPLASMVGRVLAENLTDRLRGSVVFSAASDLSIQSDTVIELALWKFDLAADGYVHLNGLTSVRGSGPQSSRVFALQARPATPDPDAVVATMSDLLGQLADEIAALLAGGAVNPPPAE